MSIRTNISIDENIDSIAKKFAKTKKLKFSNLIEVALEHFLKAEGYIAENKEVELFDIVREMLADGRTAEEIEVHLRQLGRKEVA